MSEQTKSTTVSFEQAANDPVEETPAAEPTKALVKPEENRTAEYKRTADAEGEIDRSDTQTPRLSVVAKTGDLSNMFKPGNVVLNKLHEFANESPLTVAACFIKKYYREAVDFDDPHTENPRIFSTAEEVRNGGLRVAASPCSRAYEEEAVPLADILLFVLKPDDASEKQAEAFGITLPSGKVGGLYLYTAGRTNYNSVAKTLFTSLGQNKRVKDNGLVSQLWKFQPSLEKWENKTWYQARITPSGSLSAEDVAAIKEIVGV